MAPKDLKFISNTLESTTSWVTLATMRVVSGYRFEEFELDLKERRLRRNSVDVKLRPKTFELLRLLVERQGEVVSTEDILQVVWPDVFVDKGTLQQTVYEIREALGE